MFDITNQKLIFDYPEEKFDFLSIFVNHFQYFLPNINESFKIEDLHQYFLDLPKDLITVDNDQDQDIYNLLYKIDKGYSFDFRVIPKNKYKEPSNSASYSQNIDFKIGQYYSETHLKL